MDVTVELETALRDLRGIIHRLSVVEKQQLPKHGETLAELLKQGDDFQKGLVLPSNPILDRLPFKTYTGPITSLTYMSYYPTQVTQPLSLLSVEWAHDYKDFRRSEMIEHEQDTIEKYALPILIDKFLDLFFYGNDRASGLHQLIPPEYTRHSGSGTGTALNYSHFVELVETLRTPELIVSSPCISSLVQRSLFENARGVEQRFMRVPWASTTAIRDTETAENGAYHKPTGGACSSIFVLDFGGIEGIQGRGIKYQSGIAKSLLVWDVGVILPQSHSCGKIDGIWTYRSVQ